ncbi:putative mitochondrial carrier [Venturia nashicola]|uniref:Carboxylic ester hydrolase n=1 Tax=Venturia nashicola TaxID=86259 RepID=A0A4Z1NYR8_9PEZI|nr:putative mitochondrial carrier [Venturia nashicola]
MFAFTSWFWLFAGMSTAGLVQLRDGASSEPIAVTMNGSYAGVYDSVYKQDWFLGVPYAIPPIGEGRFRVPMSLNGTWTGTKNAKAYSKECVGYGSDQWPYETSEDCLYLNVVRPAGYENTKLPVAFWIHGGGYYQGGGVDQRYNLSFIVQNSVKIGKPIIGVSINYRLSAWGFLYSREIQGSGATNLGLRDQRLALHWLQENIEGFGGDPEKVTIFGESAGASSVGFHLTAYNGRDDKLFRAAAMESGNPVAYGELNTSEWYQPLYDAISAQAGCNNTINSLECLRAIPFETLNSVINGTTKASNGASLTDFSPTVDGDFIARYTSLQMADGSFVKVPIISGANSDEGTAFSPQGINTTTDFAALLPPPTPHPPPPSLPQRPIRPPYGPQYRRSASYHGDAFFIAARRLTCKTWSLHSLPAYCYRFTALTSNVVPVTGVTHYQEIAFVFLNLRRVGYAPPNKNPFEGMGEGTRELARFISSSWVGFVSDLDPNSWRKRAGWNGSEVEWPKYDVGNPLNIVLDANLTSPTKNAVLHLEQAGKMNILK